MRKELPFVNVYVRGTPVPQGSKKWLGMSSGGRPRFREQAGNRLDSWRADVRAALEGATAGTETGPVSVEIDFYRPRRKSDKDHHRPMFTMAPDVDKLTRAVLDCLEASGVLTNDAQVVHLDVWKLFAPPGHPSGARITVCRVVP